MSVGTILLIILVLLIVGVLPGAWPHTREMNWYPSGGLGIVLLILIVLIIAGRL